MHQWTEWKSEKAGATDISRTITSTRAPVGAKNMDSLNMNLISLNSLLSELIRHDLCFKVFSLSSTSLPNMRRKTGQIFTIDICISEKSTWVCKVHRNYVSSQMLTLLEEKSLGLVKCDIDFQIFSQIPGKWFKNLQSNRIHFSN